MERVTTARRVAIAAMLVWGCEGTVTTTPDPERDGGRREDPTDGGELVRPDAPPWVDVTPGAPGCGLTSAAFCDTFDAPAANAQLRSGELDPTFWSIARARPGLNWGDEAIAVRHATLAPCRAGQPLTVHPGEDALICDGYATLPSRHLLLTAAEQSYGQASARIRRPFDFRDRTGTVVFDLAGDVGSPVLGWPAVAITADPSPAPSFAAVQNFENGAIPRAGVEVHLMGVCGEGRIGVSLVSVFDEHVEHHFGPTGGAPYPTTECIDITPGALNHFELRVSRSHLELYGTQPSEDGLTFGEPILLFETDIDLSFEVGYVHVSTHNHSTLKYSAGHTIDAWSTRWDNVAFDGPQIDGWRESSVPDLMELVEVAVEHDFVALFGDREMRMNVGYQIAAFGAEPRHVLTFPNVDPTGVTSASLALDVQYTPSDAIPFRDYVLHYRLNGGDWHAAPLPENQLRFLESPVVFDYEGVQAPADERGPSSGALALMIDIDPTSLIPGDNRIEFTVAGAPQSYRPNLANLDLIMRTD